MKIQKLFILAQLLVALNGPALAQPSVATPADAAQLRDTPVFERTAVVISTAIKEIGEGACKAYVGPIAEVGDGLIVNVEFQKINRCKFKYLILHSKGKNYELSQVSGMQPDEKGVYWNTNYKAKLYFKTEGQNPVEAIGETYGLWEYLCNSSCLTDTSIVSAAKNVKQAADKKAAEEKLAQEQETLRQQAAQCINAIVPNPNPLPNETTQFYGTCRDNQGQNGLIIWLQSGVPFNISCLENGKFVNVGTCGKHVPFLPSYCIVKDYKGQCKNGVPEGVGFEFLRETDTNGSIKYTGKLGQYQNGSLHGYGYKSFKNCGTGFYANDCTKEEQQAGYFEKDNFVLPCKGGLEGCQKALAAEPVYKNAQHAANAGRCSEALALDRKAQNMDGQKHSDSERENGARINLHTCNQDAAFNALLNSKNPRAMYLGAVDLEDKGERGRAKSVYRSVTQRFPNAQEALLASQRLTRLADVEAVESSNAYAASAARDAASGVRQQNYDQCMAERTACYSRCSSLKSGQSSCQSGCALCSR